MFEEIPVAGAEAPELIGERGEGQGGGILHLVLVSHDGPDVDVEGAIFRGDDGAVFRDGDGSEDF